MGKMRRYSAVCIIALFIVAMGLSAVVVDAWYYLDQVSFQGYGPVTRTMPVYQFCYLSENLDNVHFSIDIMDMTSRTAEDARKQAQQQGGTTRGPIIYTEIDKPVEFRETVLGYAATRCIAESSPIVLFHVLLSGQTVAIEISKDDQVVSAYTTKSGGKGQITFSFVPDEPGSYEVIIKPVYEERAYGLISKRYDVTATPVESKIPGFGAIVAISSLAAIAFLLQKRKR